MSQFELVPFGESAPVEAVCCDGLVDGCKLQLSHWPGNRTPPELKRDTSVEIALAASDAGVRPALVVNNHFDTDGVLAVFCLLRPEIAREHRDLLVAAAEAGDFDEWSTEPGLKLEMAIRKLGALKTERAAYERVLSELPSLLEDLGARPELWRSEWAALAADEERAERDATFATRGALAVVVHHAGRAPLAGAVISKRTRGSRRLLQAFERRDGRFEYFYALPGYAWADTVVRPILQKPSRNALARDLGEGWALKGELGMTGLLRTTSPVATKPFDVAERLLLRETDDVRAA